MLGLLRIRDKIWVKTLDKIYFSFDFKITAKIPIFGITGFLIPKNMGIDTKIFTLARLELNDGPIRDFAYLNGSHC